MTNWVKDLLTVIEVELKAKLPTGVKIQLREGNTGKSVLEPKILIRSKNCDDLTIKALGRSTVKMGTKSFHVNDIDAIIAEVKHKLVV